MELKTVWEKYNENDLKELDVFTEDYRAFLSKAKTEREFVKEAVALIEANGFKNLAAVNGSLKAGDKVYVVNKNKNLCMFVIGEKPLTEGMNILGAHIDSPRLDLKQKPLYEKDGLALMDTHYYGGIKKYQWVARPMALHGVICKKDGITVDIVVGEDEKDPVVGIGDLLIHLAAEQMKKPASTVITGEQLDVLVGSIPLAKEEKDAVKANVLHILKEKYGVEEDDFISAEIEVVPAGNARSYGLDSSMILGYGHDDRVCAYTSMRAIMEMEKPERTSCCILVDKEEIGSVGATGMQSRFFENTIAKMLSMNGVESLVKLNETFEASKMLSSDVSSAVDPNFADVDDPKNAAYFGKGIVFNKYTGARGKSGSNDANPEFIAEIRAAMAKDNIQFQTCELGKVDVGGGGTIAYILANLNMDVIDAGIAVQNMHAPCEIVSKADVFEGYRAYKAFLKHIG